jgi:hypothetical protein
VECRGISDTNVSRYADGLLEKETKKNTIDELASYRGKALTILVCFASMSMGQRTWRICLD